MAARKTYELFITKIKELSLFSSTQQLLSWDQETYMPSGSLANRAAQMQLLSGMFHELFTTPQIGEWLNTLTENSNFSELTEHERINVREIKREYERATKIPTQLVKAFSHARSLSQHAWMTARQNDDFSHFHPHLETILKLKRESASYLGFSNLYDAILDPYEAGMTEAKLESIFANLKSQLIPIAREAGEKFLKSNPISITGHFPTDKQRDMCMLILEKMGFDLTRGRMDTTTHPFCMGMQGDVRLTVRYDESDFRDSFTSALHEGGHALYEQGFLEEHAYTPMAEAVSTGIHESQSRLWENMIGRSRPFMEYILPLFRQHYPSPMQDVTTEQLFHFFNEIKPGFIRVDADEVNYNLHIILRFELEQALIANRLAVRDLPEAWNEKMQGYLNITPPTNRLGLLQDIHWSIGAFGYFPTYTLGNLYAAQFFGAIQKSLPNLDDLVRRGEFSPILNWLREHIHHFGKQYLSDELCQRVTGETLNPDYFVAHVRQKFLES